MKHKNTHSKFTSYMYKGVGLIAAIGGLSISAWYAVNSNPTTHANMVGGDNRVNMPLSANNLLNNTCIKQDVPDLAEQEVFAHEQQKIVSKYQGSLSNTQRRQLIGELRDLTLKQEKQVKAKAEVFNLPMVRETTSEQVALLVAFKEDQPLYIQGEGLKEQSATTATSFVRQTAPYNADGDGFFIGIFDVGKVALQAKFQLPDGNYRIFYRDSGSATKSHSNSVASVLAADNDNSDSRGMAPASTLYSYTGNAAVHEMLDDGMSWPGQPGKMIISNQSLGWTSDTVQIGQYTDSDANIDYSIYHTPYLLPFFSAGNNGSNGWNSLSYGYKLAKNVMAVGVTSAGTRDASGNLSSGAALLSKSSKGPTDDGRIKPDILAHGGATSTSSPNAAGSALLLQDYFNQLFPGQLMRSSTLKGLICHTAEDLGNAGPDYKHGWGLMDSLRAAKHIEQHAAQPEDMMMIEGIIREGEKITLPFAWDGTQAIRATLCWIDPAGPGQTVNDSRTSVLVNDLDMALESPNSSIHSPYVMPYVTSNFDSNYYDTPATTGLNTTDAIEQIDVSSPVAGQYALSIQAPASLTDDCQHYSLLVSGASFSGTMTPLTVSGFLANSDAWAEARIFEIQGTGFQLGSKVKLRRAGSVDLNAFGVIEVFRGTTSGQVLQARFHMGDSAPGTYDLVVETPDGRSITLSAALHVPLRKEIFYEDFESGSTGWQTGATVGSSEWQLISNKGHSGSHSFYTPNQAVTSETWLESPSISIPSNTEHLQLSFWNHYDFETRWDGGMLQISKSNGPWTDVTEGTNPGIFKMNGYNTSQFSNGYSFWSSYSGNFVQTVLSLDANTLAGQAVRFRWSAISDSNTAMQGWHVDDVRMVASSFVTDPSGFQIWMANQENPLDDNWATGDDPDVDSWSNLLEYALGSAPDTSDVSNPTFRPSSDLISGPALDYTFRRMKGGTGDIREEYEAQGISYRLEISETLNSWIPVSSSATLQGLPTDQGDGYELLTYRLNAPFGWTRLFARLIVEEKN